MPRFVVPEMSCDACVRAVTRAVHAADTQASVRADLATHSVDITSRLPDGALAAAIAAAGFETAKAA